MEITYAFSPQYHLLENDYILAASTLTSGCGMSVLVGADGKPIVTPMN